MKKNLKTLLKELWLKYSEKVGKTTDDMEYIVGQSVICSEDFDKIINILISDISYNHEFLYDDYSITVDDDILLLIYYVDKHILTRDKYNELIKEFLSSVNAVEYVYS